jgi:hypothetical protein
VRSPAREARPVDIAILFRFSAIVTVFNLLAVIAFVAGLIFGS